MGDGKNLGTAGGKSARDCSVRPTRQVRGHSQFDTSRVMQRPTHSDYPHHVFLYSTFVGMIGTLFYLYNRLLLSAGGFAVHARYVLICVWTSLSSFLLSSHPAPSLQAVSELRMYSPICLQKESNTVTLCSCCWLRHEICHRTSNGFVREK